MPSLIKSMEFQQFQSFTDVLDKLIAKDPVDVLASFSLYRGETSLLLQHLQPSGDFAERFVHVIVNGKNSERLIVGFFGSKDAFLAKSIMAREAQGRGLAMEAIYDLMRAFDTDAHHKDKMNELAKQILKFLKHGELLDPTTMKNELPVLAERTVAFESPKLR